MSVIDRHGFKVILPRSGSDEFWKRIHEHYACDDPRAWKYLAMLALRENAGWPLEHIGRVFDHPKGHISRCLATIKRELRTRFRASPDWLDLDPDENAECGMRSAEGPYD